MLDFRLTRNISSIIFDFDHPTQIFDGKKVGLTISGSAMWPKYQLFSDDVNLTQLQIIAALLSGSPHGFSPDQDVIYALNFMNNRPNTSGKPLLSPLQKIRNTLGLDQLYLSTPLEDDNLMQKHFGSTEITMSKAWWPILLPPTSQSFQRRLSFGLECFVSAKVQLYATRATDNLLTTLHGLNFIRMNHRDPKALGKVWWRKSRAVIGHPSVGSMQTLASVWWWSIPGHPGAECMVPKNTKKITPKNTPHRQSLDHPFTWFELHPHVDHTVIQIDWVCLSPTIDQQRFQIRQSLRYYKMLNVDLSVRKHAYRKHAPTYIILNAPTPLNKLSVTIIDRALWPSVGTRLSSNFWQRIKHTSIFMVWLLSILWSDFKSPDTQEQQIKIFFIDRCQSQCRKL